MRALGMLLGLWLLAGSVAAQELTEEDDYELETTWGVTINTNGGLPAGAAFKRAIRLGEGQYKRYSLEIVNVKHPKELRSVNPTTGNSFVYGKSNYFFVIRPAYGREWVLFHKAPEQGVQINAVVAAGPSIGLLKPYYIYYDYSSNGGFPAGTDIRLVPFDGEVHSDDPNAILSSGGIFTGFGESKIRPGLHVRGALSFETGAFRGSVTGFELGFLLEAYTRTINIHTFATNRTVFTAAYLTAFFGSRR